MLLPAPLSPEKRLLLPAWGIHLAGTVYSPLLIVLPIYHSEWVYKVASFWVKNPSQRLTMGGDWSPAWGWDTLYWWPCCPPLRSPRWRGRPSWPGRARPRSRTCCSCPASWLPRPRGSRPPPHSDIGRAGNCTFIIKQSVF